MRRRIVAALLVAATIVPALGQGGRLGPANRQLEDGRFGDAERTFRDLLEDYPALIEAHEGLVAALVGQGRRGEALSWLLEAGQSLVRSGQLTPGTRFLERAVGLDPDLASAQAALGHAYLQSQRYREAETHLQRAIELGETSPLARLFLGAAYWELGAYDKAETAYGELLALAGPSAAAARRSLGALHVFRGEYDAAIPLLAAALGENAGSTQVRYDLARAFEGAVRIAEAIELYEAAIADAPDFLQAHYRLARLYRTVDQSDRSAHHFERFSALHAAHQERTRAEGLLTARLNQGWALLRQDEAEAARALFEGLPPGPDTLSGLGQAQYRCGDLDAAVRTIERLLATDPERLDVRLLLDEWRLETANR